MIKKPSDVVTIDQLDRWIYFCLLLYAFSSCISIAGANVAISFGTLFAIIRLYKRPIVVWNILDKGVLKAIGIFLVAIAISAAFADQPSIGLKRLWGYIYRMVPIFLVPLFIRDGKALHKLVVAMFISMCIADVYALWQGYNGEYRATAFSSNAMILAGFLIQVTPIAIVLCMEENVKLIPTKLLYLLTIILSSGALLVNGTRGAWLAILIVLVIYAIAKARTNRKIFVAISVSIILTIIIGSQLSGVVSRVNTFTDVKYQSNSERVLLWQSSIAMFIDHPVVGVGPEHYGDLYRNQYISPDAKERKLGHAHNNFLHILAENGIIGFISFCYLFFHILHFHYLKYKQYPQIFKRSWSGIACLVTLSFLIQGMTEFNFGDSAVIRLYWFILGLSHAYQNLYVPLTE